MAKVRVKMQREGSRAVLKSDGVRVDLAARAEAIARTAGNGFDARHGVGRTRVFSNVVAVTPDAMIAESENHALTRALDAGR